MPTVLLVRHAQASFGAEDYDVLSPKGHEQVATLVEDLERRGVSISHVVCGSLVRQKDTARAIARAHGLDMSVDERWNEYEPDLILQAHSTSDVRLESASAGARAPQSSAAFQDELDVALRAWIDAGEDGGAPGSWSAFRSRVQAALDELRGTLVSGDTAVVVTSGGPIAAAAADALGAPEALFIALNRVLVNASVTRLVSGGRGTTLISFNDYSHLERRSPALTTYR